MNPPADRWSRRLAAAQGLFYFVSGLWPVVHMPSFVIVTGPKTDLWLVQTVGTLLAVTGAVLIRVARRVRVTSEWKLLAAGQAAVLAGVDIVFVARDVIGSIYLADAAVEIALIAAWVLTARRARRSQAALRR